MRTIFRASRRGNVVTLLAPVALILLSLVVGGAADTVTNTLLINDHVIVANAVISVCPSVADLKLALFHFSASQKLAADIATLQVAINNGMKSCTSAQIIKMVTPGTTSYVDAVSKLNDLGNRATKVTTFPSATSQVGTTILTTVRKATCTQAKSSNSKVDPLVTACLCDETQPYVLCQAQLGASAHLFASAKVRRDLESGAHQRRQVQAEKRRNRRTQVCSLTVVPSTTSTPDFASILAIATNTDTISTTAMSITDECCLDLEPPPLDLFSICGDITLSLPFTNYSQLAFGSPAIKSAAAIADIGAQLKLCFVAEVLLASAPELKYLFDFLGIDFLRRFVEH